MPPLWARWIQGVFPVTPSSLRGLKKSLPVAWRVGELLWPVAGPSLRKNHRKTQRFFSSLVYWRSVAPKRIGKGLCRMMLFNLMLLRVWLACKCEFRADIVGDRCVVDPFFLLRSWTKKVAFWDRKELAVKFGIWRLVNSLHVLKHFFMEESGLKTKTFGQFSTTSTSTILSLALGWLMGSSDLQNSLLKISHCWPPAVPLGLRRRRLLGVSFLSWVAWGAWLLGRLSTRRYRLQRPALPEAAGMWGSSKRPRGKTCFFLGGLRFC